MESILLFISGAEIVIVLVVILLLFGSKKIPELAQGLGKGMKEFKRAADDIKKEIKDETDILDDIKDFKDDINKKL
ncbi:twin-arginine translocase TatA/TatE family subunit [Marinifilum sp. D714]|uniref:twin-arginine translocase TatA/TatE family subunit n=1 Tax=Marinifilum sp. D714 TaxID=2937523 RepID=UPI0027BC845E|nr:twin-arginine translocase TatA/TatE family subunit [Marinifilum sp. D714]MDQ2179268.1 twin-arginine translocase TatA/TatE family subunit [Marinifilum sp. D714]